MQVGVYPWRQKDRIWYVAYEVVCVCIVAQVAQRLHMLTNQMHIPKCREHQDAFNATLVY